jgi:hypothetical protein
MTHVQTDTAPKGIVTKYERDYRFFSSDRIFDSLEGREFRSAPVAERAAPALLSERRHFAGLRFAKRAKSPAWDVRHFTN